MLGCYTRGEETRILMISFIKELEFYGSSSLNLFYDGRLLKLLVMHGYEFDFIFSYLKLVMGGSEQGLMPRWIFN